MSRSIIVLCCLALVPLCAGAADPPNRATYYSPTGTWTFDYRSTVTQQMVRQDFVLHSLTAPLVTSTVDGTTGTTRYRYSATNGASGKQPISSLWIRSAPFSAAPLLPESPPTRTSSDPAVVRAYLEALDARHIAERAAQAAIINSPTGWDGSIGLNTQPTAFGWHWRVRGNTVASGIVRGGSASGFQVLRPELPGAVLMCVRGFSPTVDIPGDLPENDSRISSALDQINKTDNLWVPVFVPAIAIPEPFSALTFVQRLRAHVQTWHNPASTGPGLATAPFLASADRHLETLGNALNLNNATAAKAAVAELLALIAQSQPAQAALPVRGAALSTPATGPMPAAQATGAGTFNPTAPSTTTVHDVAARALRYNLAELLGRAGVAYP